MEPYFKVVAYMKDVHQEIGLDVLTAKSPNSTTETPAALPSVASSV